MATAETSAKEYLTYDFECYKEALKERLKDRRRLRSTITAKWLAGKVEIQHTYLSRCLNDERSHLSEDHLYKIGRHLDLLPDEIEYLLLLRMYSTTQDTHRKEMLFRKIDQTRKSKTVSGDQKEWRPEDIKNETAYLFAPLCIVTHVALFIKEYQKNPRLLCTHLGISSEKLKDVLKILDASEYIVLSANDPLEVLEVKSKYPSFGREHPLMRAHQTVLKTALLGRLNQTSESEKDSILATFTMNDEGFAQVREAFKEFLGKVQKISFEAKHEHVYQLSFDFLKWI